MKSPDTNTLTQNLAAKCELLVKLRQLGVQQAELIAASELGQLLSLLATKQRLLNELQAIERRLDPFRSQSPDDRTWPSSEERRRCAELAAACEKLLAEVVETEKTSETQLLQRRDEAAVQLQAVHFAAQTRDAYATPSFPSISQVDLSTG